MTSPSRKTRPFLPFLAVTVLLCASSARADGPYTAISIDSLTCSTGGFIVKGQAATITCEASDKDDVDPCGIVDDDLTFSFTATGGTTGDLDYPDENDPNKVTIPWTADCAVGTYTITATVNDVPYHVDDSAPATASVTVEVVDIEYIKVRRKDAISAPYETSADIVAGGYSSDVHKASVAIKITPVPSGTYSVPVPVTLTGADGHSGDAVDAKLAFGGTTIQEGDGTGVVTISDTNSAAGERVGCLFSSNRRTACGVSAGSQSASVQPVWGKRDAAQFAVLTVFIPGVSANGSFTLATEDGAAIEGHAIDWETTSVRLWCYQCNYATGEEFFFTDSFTDEDELPFGLTLGSFVTYDNESASSGVYATDHTVTDYWEDVELDGQLYYCEALVLAYEYRVYDDVVYPD